MSETSQGEGWWQASDGKWYPPEQHPDYQPSLPPPPPPPATSTDEAKPPFWKRGWFLITAALMVVLLVVAALLSDPADNGVETSGPDSSDSTDATSDDSAPNEDDSIPTTDSSTTTTTTETTSSTAEAAPTSTVATTSSSIPPPTEFEEGCGYAGLDSFDDVQVDLRIRNPLSEPGDIAVTYALSDGEGIRFLTETEFIEAASPGEMIRVNSDTVEKLPSSVADEGAISCQFLSIEDSGFGARPLLPDGASCAFVEIDSFDDIQVEITVSNPFSDATDLAVTYALRGTDGVRFHTRTAFIDAVAVGETVRMMEDTVTELPDWVDVEDFSCDVVDVMDFGF